MEKRCFCLKRYGLWLLLLSFLLLLSSFSNAQLSVKPVEFRNYTVYLNSSVIELDCNVTLSAPNDPINVNVTLYHNFNGTWLPSRSNVTQLPSNLPIPFSFSANSNLTNGTFKWGCFAKNVSAVNPISASGANSSLVIYHNFSIRHLGKLNGETLPFSGNIFITYAIEGFEVSLLHMDIPGDPSYNCSLYANISKTGVGSGDTLLKKSSSNLLNPQMNPPEHRGLNGSNADPFGGLMSRSPPFALDNIQLGTGANAAATVSYIVSCTDANGIKINSSEVKFNIDLGSANFFDPENFDFIIDGEQFAFSEGPPFIFGFDENDSVAYTSGSGANLLGLAEKDGPFTITIMGVGGFKHDPTPGAPCAGQNPFSCNSYTGTRYTPRCTANSSAPLRVMYSLYIDNDGNQSTGCSVNSTEGNHTGFDSQIFINMSSTSASPQVRFCANRSDANRWIDFDSSANYNTSGNVQASLDNQFGCNDGALAIKWDLSVAEAYLGLSETDLAEVEPWFAKSWNGTTGAEIDSFNDRAFFTGGSIDFIPFDPFKCEAGNDFGVNSSAYATSDSNKGKCDAFLNGPGFFNQSLLGEDCFNHRDDDSDGKTDLSDEDCSFMPEFSGTDNKAPDVVFNKVDAFDTEAVAIWNTNEPTKGTVIFYGANESGKNASNPGAATCSVLSNSTVVDDPIPGATFDDYKPFHSVPLDSVASDSLGFQLSSSTTYYYKLNSTDRSGNTALSNCLKFTTKAAGGARFDDNKQINFPFADFGNFGAQFHIDTGSGFGKFDPTQGANIPGGKGFNLKFAPPGNNFGFVFGGIDLTGNSTVNFTNKFKINTSASVPFLGIDHDTWLELVQDLKVDYVDLTIPSTGDKLFKCAEDGASNCTDVTSLAVLVGSTAESTTWRVGTDIGFSTLSMINSTFSATTERTEYACFPTCNIIINYTNNDTGLAALNHTVQVFNSTGDSNIVIGQVRVLNITTGKFFILPPGQSRNISINTSTTPLQFNVTVNITNYTSGRINITIAINGTRKPALRPYVGALNLTSPEDGHALSGTASKALTFSAALFSTFDTNQSCAFSVNSSTSLNVSTFNALNNSVTSFTAKVGALSSGVYKWNVTCDNGANETTVSTEARLFNFTKTATAQEDTPPASSGSSGSSGGGGVASTKTTDIAESKAQVWGIISAGSGVTMSIDSDNIALTSIEVSNVNKELAGVELKASALKSNPVSSTPGTTFQYLEISGKNIEGGDADAVKLSFKVPVSWITESGLKSADLSLYRYSNGWAKLSTKVTGSDSKYVNYEATTPGFSYFAVAAASASSEAPQEEAETPSEVPAAQPGEEPGVAPEAPITGEGKKLNLTLIIMLILVVLAAGAIIFSKMQKRKKGNVDKVISEISERKKK